MAVWMETVRCVTTGVLLRWIRSWSRHVPISYHLLSVLLFSPFAASPPVHSVLPLSSLLFFSFSPPFFSGVKANARRTVNMCTPIWHATVSRRMRGQLSFSTSSGARLFVLAPPVPLVPRLLSLRCSLSEDSMDIELSSENSVQLRLCFLCQPPVFSHRDSCTAHCHSAVCKCKPCRQRKSHLLYQTLSRGVMTPTLTPVRPGL